MSRSQTNTTDSSRWNAAANVLVVNIPAQLAEQPPPAIAAAVPGTLLVSPQALDEWHDTSLAVAAEEAHASGALDLRPYEAYRRRRLTAGN